MTGIFQNIADFLSARQSEFSLIDSSRLRTLNSFADAIKESLFKRNRAEVIFVCTHNSRRSQIAQMIFSASTKLLNVSGIESFSGGTEITEFHPNSIQALAEIGFSIERDLIGNQNPKYLVRSGGENSPISGFSKIYSDFPNPSKEFIAVMVCSSADKACPFVFGAEKRISLPYSDPKAYDHTAEAPERYLNTCKEIAREMLYVLGEVKG